MAFSVTSDVNNGIARITLTRGARRRLGARKAEIEAAWKPRRLALVVDTLEMTGFQHGVVMLPEYDGGARIER